MIAESLKKPSGLMNFKQYLKAQQGPPDGNRIMNNYEEAVSRLHNAGWKELGTGASATVFQNNNFPKQILKIFMHDQAYTKWYNFCKFNQDNPWIPKVYGGYITVAPGLHAVRLEKLRPASPQEWARFVALWKEWAGVTTLDRNTMFRTQYDMNAHITSGDMDLDWILEWIHTKKNHGGLIDLHPGNIMMRGNQIVVIDPLMG